MSTAANPEISTAAVEVSGVAHRFRSKRSEVLALRDISLRVEPGEFVSLVGRSDVGNPHCCASSPVAEPRAAGR